MIRERKTYKREGNVIRVWWGKLPKMDTQPEPRRLTAKEARIMGNVIRLKTYTYGWLEPVRQDARSGLTVWANYLRGTTPTNTIPFPYPCREQLEGDYRLARQEWARYHPDTAHDWFWYWFDEMLWLEEQLKRRHGVSQAELNALMEAV
jgi:hypothetical protein